MIHFLYFFFNVLLLIGALIMFVPFYKKEIKKNLLLFIPVTILVIPYGIITDSLGVVWKAWSYNPVTSFGAMPIGGAWDTIFFIIDTGIVFTFIVAAFAEREEKKKPLLPFK